MDPAFYLNKKDWRRLALTSACLLLLVVAYLVLGAYSPHTPNGTIRTEKKPLIYNAENLAVDRAGNFYIHCSNMTFCYGPDWEFLHLYALHDPGNIELKIENDVLHYYYVRGRIVETYSLAGNKTGSYHVEDDAWETPKWQTLPDGTGVRLQKGLFLLKVTDNNGKRLWTYPNIIMILITAFTAGWICLWRLIFKGRRQGERRREEKFGSIGKNYVSALPTVE